MRIPLWCLLVLLACAVGPGRSDCQGECVACARFLQPAFNTMVCLLQCEVQLSSSLTWQLCRRAMRLSHGPPPSEGTSAFQRRGEELEMTSMDLSAASELLQSERFQEEGPDETSFQPKSLQYDSSEEGGLDVEALGGDRQPREQRDAEATGSEGDEGGTLSKRFGGFQRGRHGYRKLFSSPGRPLQKRYGGFIGVRKSARKWNSQKRVNQLLRQYLGMRSSRSGRLTTGPLGARAWRPSTL